MRWRAAIVLLLVLAASPARADNDVRLHLEIDPQPFILGGYGIQPGIRYNHLRAALGNFRLNVPDAVAQLGGNDGFHQHVRHSNALYILYFLDEGSGFAFGGSMRLLRLSYTRDGETETARTWELGPEAIAGYKWQPTDYGFYVMPWVAIGVTLYHHGEPTVAGRTYDPLPVSLFGTMNVGWDFWL
ncbi:MAG TPA: hypothetical protein VMZ53_31950 [Kofleriaceae bacterium]|nr:hypothetical protein [Kofleriaceae bacterium]